MTYKSSKILVIAFVLSILIGGIWADHLPHHDFYPFFSWSLFSNSSDNDTSYFIKLKTFDGRPDNTVLYGGKVSDYVGGYFLPDFYWDVQEAGKTALSGSKSDLLEKIESRFKSGNVDYQIVLADYDAVVLKKTGSFKNINVIAEYKTE